MGFEQGLSCSVPLFGCSPSLLSDSLWTLSLRRSKEGYVWEIFPVVVVATSSRSGHGSRWSGQAGRVDSDRKDGRKQRGFVKGGVV